MSHDQSILSPANIVHKICAHYRFDGTQGGFEWAMSKRVELQVTAWHNWFSKTHPHHQPAAIFDKTKSNVDFRVFFLAFPIAGAHFLRVAEACYDIDTAFCGTSEVALEKAKKWRDMDQFRYLKWRDVIHWWGTELAQLQQHISTEKSCHLLNSVRVENIEAAVLGLVGILPEFRNSVGCSFKWAESSLLQKMLLDREQLLSTSLESLKNSVSHAHQRSPTKATDVREIIRHIQIINSDIVSRMPVADYKPLASSKLSLRASPLSADTWRSYCLVYMLASLVGQIVSRKIGPSQPIVSTLLGFVSSLIPVAIASFLVWEFDNAVNTGRIEVHEAD